MELTHQQRKQLQKALLEAFPSTVVSLVRMLDYELGRNLMAITGEGSLEDIVFKLIQAANAEGWVKDLLRAACDSNPGNQALFVFNTQYLKVANNPITKYFDNELAPILKKIDFQICKNVSKKVLPDLDLHSPNSRIEDVDELRKLFLQQYPDKLSDGSLAILKFTDYLANDNRLEEPVPQKLRIWVKQVTQELGLSYSSAFQMETPEIFNSYLLFFIKPQDNQFYINAYLIPNENDKEGIEPLDLESKQKGILCSYNEIKGKIFLLIKKAEKELVSLTNEAFDLTIEFFLSIDYLHEEVEHWKLTDDDSWDDEFNKFLGARHRVVVRSYDRLERPNLIQALRKGRLRLKRFRAELNEQVIHDIIEHLKELETCNWKELKNRLDEKIGLKLTCSLPLTEKERRELFKAIVISGIPIAMWTRTSNITNICLENEIQKFWNVGFIKDFRSLFELLQNERKKAYAKDEECENYLGYHLGVFCEEPNLEDFPDLKVAIANL